MNGIIKNFENNQLDGYLIVFTDGTSRNEKDLYGDYFTKETYFGFEDYTTVPILYDHSYNDIFGKSVIGEAILTLDNTGVKISGELTKEPKTTFGILEKIKSDEYQTFLQDIGILIKSGLMGLSSGTFGHGVVKDNDGYIKQWLIGEASLTVTPAEPKTIANLKSLIKNKFVLDSLKSGSRHNKSDYDAIIAIDKAVKQLLSSTDQEKEKRTNLDLFLQLI